MSDRSAVGNGTEIEVRMFETAEARASNDKAKSRLLETTGSPSRFLRLSYSDPPELLAFYIEGQEVSFDDALFGMGCYYQQENGFLRDFQKKLVFADPA